MNLLIKNTLRDKCVELFGSYERKAKIEKNFSFIFAILRTIFQNYVLDLHGGYKF